jgi:hypothetical protein
MSSWIQVKLVRQVVGRISKQYPTGNTIVSIISQWIPYTEIFGVLNTVRWTESKSRDGLYTLMKGGLKYAN